MHKFIIISLFSISFFANAKIITRKYPQHMIAHKTCDKDSRLNKNYCLEIIEFKYKSKLPKKGIALLIPGFFQNAYIWDLLPHHNISVAKYMMENFGIHPYVLHVRGIGNSDYIKDTNLDDIAIDDIPLALKFLFKKEQQKIILIGHSQGSITSLASLSGLSKCNNKINCFDKEVAISRQKLVKSLALLGGNSAMTIEREDNFLRKLLPFGLNPILQKILLFKNKIDVDVLTKISGPLAFINYWENLYVLKNVSKKSRKALLTKTVDTTSANIILQFTYALRNGDLKTIDGYSYSKNAFNISIPTILQTYEHDELAEPNPTYRDTFLNIGSSTKEFNYVKDCAHEDFFMERNLHELLNPVFKFVLN